MLIPCFKNGSDVSLLEQGRNDSMCKGGIENVCKNFGNMGNQLFEKIITDVIITAATTVLSLDVN